MKKKFNNTNNTLGNIIKMVRKDKGISQESLGKIVGLGKSSISKIETGMTQISLEDAAILLEAMGEELKLYVAGLYPSLETRKKQINFITTAICWFAEAKNVPRHIAYNYLQKHQGIKFLEENFEYEQTLPREQIIEDLTQICNNHIHSTQKDEPSNRVLA